MRVTLVKHYDPTWPLWFEELRHRFDSVLSGRYCSIEHVGSTSVAGMTAKPIIDIDIVIERQDFESTKDRLAEIGYFHEGDLGIPGRDAFDLSDSGLKESLPAHHTYVCDMYGEALKRHLVFRDFLRQSPEYAYRLSNLKWQLAGEHDNDRQSYMDGKAALCEEIYEKALEALGCRCGLYLPFDK